MIGHGATTKRRLEQASRTRFDITDAADGESCATLRIYGNPRDRAVAASFVKMVIGQRERNCMLDLELHKDHCTVLNVPQVARAVVTGKQGVAIRTRQDDWRTLMFFIDNDVPSAKSAAGSGGAKAKIESDASSPSSTVCDDEMLYVMLCFRQQDQP